MSTKSRKIHKNIDLIYRRGYNYCEYYNSIGKWKVETNPIIGRYLSCEIEQTTTDGGKRMYDMSTKFNSFYSEYVVLPQEDQNELYTKKNLNIQRLNDGLKEYNEENGTSYAVVDTCVQGSVAMSTVVQNEDNDYDTVGL